MIFSAIDYIFVGLIGVFAIRCYLKGFLSEIISMAAVVFGLLASLFFYRSGGEIVRAQFMPGVKIVPEIIAFIGLFLIVFFIFKFLEIILKGIINRIELGGADRFLGIIFGFAEGIAVVSLILFLIRIQPLFNPDSVLSESFFAKLILPLITGVKAENLPRV